MGNFPVTDAAYKELSSLSKEDKIRIIVWLSSELLATEEAANDTVSGTKTTEAKPWDEDLPSPDNLTEAEWKVAVNETAGSWNDVPKAEALSEEERIKVADKLFGSWSDHPMSAEELIEDIYSSRTISTREINLDD